MRNTRRPRPGVPVQARRRSGHRRSVRGRGRCRRRLPTGRRRRTRLAAGTVPEARADRRTARSVGDGQLGSRGRDVTASADLLDLDGGAGLFELLLELLGVVLEMPVLTSLGAASTRSLASLRPRPVAARTTLMTLILLAPKASRTTSNSVLAATGSAAAAAAGRAGGDGGGGRLDPVDVLRGSRPGPWLRGRSA